MFSEIHGTLSYLDYGFFFYCKTWSVYLTTLGVTAKITAEKKANKNSSVCDKWNQNHLLIKPAQFHFFQGTNTVRSNLRQTGLPRENPSKQ